MHFRPRTAGLALALASAMTLLTAPRAWSADKAPQGSWQSNTRVVMGTVLERKSGEIRIRTDNNEVQIITFDDPGLTVKIDPHVAQGSRVKVTEQVISGLRTLTIELAPGS